MQRYHSSYRDNKINPLAYSILLSGAFGAKRHITSNYSSSKKYLWLPLFLNGPYFRKQLLVSSAMALESREQRAAVILGDSFEEVSNHGRDEEGLNWGKKSTGK